MPTTTVDVDDAESGTSVIDNTTTANVTYFGKAHSGASRGAAVWQVKKMFINTDGDTEFAWADGDVLFDNVWANRATLTYSGSVA